MFLARGKILIMYLRFRLKRHENSRLPVSDSLNPVYMSQTLVKTSKNFNSSVSELKKKPIYLSMFP